MWVSLSPFFLLCHIIWHPQHLLTAIVESQCGAMVSKAHLDYAMHEVPLPLFGFGHDWVCIFREAPLPQCGQARAVTT